MKQKTLRMVLGFGMMACFLNIIQFIYFFVSINLSVGNKIIALFSFQWMWFPNIILIAIIYLLLTRWFPYKKVER